MARIESLSILLDPQGKAFLQELYGKVIANVQKSTLSTAFKNKDLSGDPTAGSVEANRYKNSKSQDYGTARGEGKGKNIVAKPVVIKIDNDKEIVEEVEAKDIKLYGVDGVLTRRSANHVASMVRELEEAFYLETANGADRHYVPQEGESVADTLESIFVELETTRNDYVNGVDRALMVAVLNPIKYSEIRTYLDVAVNNANVNTASEAFGMYHGVRIYSSVYLPKGVEALVFVEGSVAQPAYDSGYGAEKIPLSEAFAVELFYYYGTKVVTPDLIINWKKVLQTPTATISGDTLTIGNVANATAYEIRAQVEGAPEFVIGELQEAGTFDLSIADLREGTAYTIKVVATNKQDGYQESVAATQQYTA